MPIVAEASTSTTTTPNPLPPWLTTRSTLSFYPGLLDLDFTAPARVPVTASTSTTTTTTTTTTTSSTTTTTITTTTTTVSSTTTTAGEVTTRTGPADKLLYTAERNSSGGGVRIVLSTLPPRPAPRHHTRTASPASLCPPRRIRALSWDWTSPGATPALACPPGTAGTARWSCLAGPTGPRWEPASPDLSDCQSLWMEKIIRDLKKSEQIVNLASDLMQYVSVNPLYGGDIKSTIDAITIIAEKMEWQLREIPTLEQREAMVMELVQSVVRAASALLAPPNLPAWEDLPRLQQTRFLSLFLTALERTGALLPGAVLPDKEVSISADNLLLTVRKISFRQIRGSEFPSRAALATPHWRRYGDSVHVPALVLMENMDSHDSADVVFLGLRHLDRLLRPGNSSTAAVLNSGLVQVGVGGAGSGARLGEPLRLTFTHRAAGRGGAARCVLWDRSTEQWEGRACTTVLTNTSHTECECSRAGTFGLLEDVVQADSVARMTFLVMVIIAVSVSVIAFISLILVILYCHRVKVNMFCSAGPLV